MNTLHRESYFVKQQAIRLKLEKRLSNELVPTVLLRGKNEKYYRV